jgi:hypothetical protein
MGFILSKFDNVDKQLSWKTKSANFIQEQIDNLNNQISITDIKLLVKNVTTKKTPGPDVLTDIINKGFKEIMSDNKCPRKIEKETIFSNSLWI